MNFDLLFIATSNVYFINWGPSIVQYINRGAKIIKCFLRAFPTHLHFFQNRDFKLQPTSINEVSKYRNLILISLKAKKTLNPKTPIPSEKFINLTLSSLERIWLEAVCVIFIQVNKNLIHWADLKWRNFQLIKLKKFQKICWEW